MSQPTVFPFEATKAELEASVAPFVKAVIGSLQSSFMVMPKGDGFVDYPTFEAGYQSLRVATKGFENLTADTVMAAIERSPMAFVVLRTILGFTAPEWAYVAVQRKGVEITEGYARSIDKRIRENPDRPFVVQKDSAPRVRALLETACELIGEGAPKVLRARRRPP